jgi:DNA-binding winged helix-turn-helix (wHTH) protein
MRLRFDDCVIDPGSRELTRKGRRVDLTPKAFDLLQALLVRRPNVVKRAELYDLLWPDAFVASTSLPRIVNELRKAIGDSKGASKLIRTVYGFGYAFSGSASEERDGHSPTRSVCEVVWGDRAIPLNQGENVIGRAGDSTVSIASSRVSRQHARILVTGAEAVIEDLGSKNGTLVHGKTIEGARSLVSGDEITIGPAILVFRAPGPGGTTVSGTRKP